MKNNQLQIGSETKKNIYKDMLKRGKYRVSLMSGHVGNIVNKCAQIDGNVQLMHRVHLNLAKSFDRCIATGGKHIEDVIY